MQYLERLDLPGSASWYSLLGEYDGSVRRWVVSTESTRQIANEPELVGMKFTEAMRTGMTEAMEGAPFRELLESVGSNQLTIVNFLRGGLNFALRDALWNALGSQYHVTCFMSSQRHRSDGRWHVKEDMYRKIQIPSEAILLIGDVVATGVTVDNGLEVVYRDLLEKKTSIQGLIFFTVGCHKVEKVLERFHRKFVDSFPGYQKTHLVYLEGKMRLVDSQLKLSNSIQGTDLVKTGTLLAPEFAASQYQSMSAPLERCVIYDAGSRAFDVREYLEDVSRYWSQVATLASRGRTLAEVLDERWPETVHTGLDSFLEECRKTWRGISEEFLTALWTARLERSEYLRRHGDSDSLRELCRERMSVFKQLEVAAGDSN